VEIISKSRSQRKQKLTMRQELFCQEYIKNGGNAAEACLAAYPTSRKWTRNALDVKASRLVNQAKIRLRIDFLRQEAEHRSKISTDRVLKEEQCLSFADPGELFDENGLLIPLPDLPAHARRAISSFKATPIWSHQEKCPHCNQYAHVGPKGGIRSIRLYRFEI
jgi:hypothetical protein